MYDQSEIGREVHALLSLLVKQHVKSWYVELSQNEDLFQYFDGLTEHINRTLNLRVGAVLWDDFILRTLPEMVLRHLEDFNIALDRSRTDLCLTAAFENLQSHVGVANQEEYLMHIADALLIVLLPENDLMSEVAYSFAREVLADLVLETVIERLSEPWFWEENLLRLFESLRTRFATWPFDWLQGIRSVCASAVRRIFRTAPRPCVSVKESELTEKPEIDFIVSGIASGPSLYDRILRSVRARSSIYESAVPGIVHQLAKPSSYPFLKAISDTLLLPLIDVLYGQQIIKHARTFTEDMISHSSFASLVRFARAVLFPNDEPSASRVTPTSVQQAATRAEIAEILPDGVNLPFLESKQINKILLFKILDALLCTIFPELQKRSPEQLREVVARIRQANVEAEGSGGIRTGQTQSGNANTRSPTILGNATDRTIQNLQKFNAEHDGMEALEAMRRSFEIKRRDE